MNNINSNHEEELAGTIRIYADNDSTSSDKLLLLPQPTESPNDPLNWSYWRRMWSASLVLFITALTAATSNSAGAAGTALVNDYGIGWGVQNTAAGVLFLGIGYATLALSSAPWLYGRRISYIICLVASIIGSIWFARSDSKGDTIGCQLFLGISESVAEATAQLSLTDVTFQHQRGSVLGFYILATSVGTFLGPLVSGFIADSPLGWRWMGWLSLIISFCTLVVFYFGLEETAFDRDSILDGLATGRSSAESDIPGEKKTTSTPAVVVSSSDNTSDRSPPKNKIPNAGDLTPKPYLQRIALITPSPTLIGTGLKQYLRRTFHTLRIFYFPAVIYSGLQWGAQDAFLSFYLTVEDDNWTSAPFNYGDRADAIMCLPTLIGAVLGCVYGGWFSDLFVRWLAKRNNNGVSEAEDRLWLMFLPATISPIGLILFGRGTDEAWTWPVPYVGLGFIGFGFGCGGDLSMAYLMDAYPDMVQEGMTGVAVLNNSIACIFTFTCSIWLDAHSVTEVFSALAIMSFVVMFVGTIFMMVYGKACRRWTAAKYKEFLYIRGSV